LLRNSPEERFSHLLSVGSLKSCKMQEFVCRDTANVEREMYDYAENKWSSQDGNKMFKERFGTIAGKHLTLSLIVLGTSHKIWEVLWSET
jgi:hypothetical protein